MGSSFSVYIGPYVEVVGEITSSVEKVKRVCPNHPKLKITDEKYCSNCGTLIESKHYTETKKRRVDDFLYEFDNSFDDEMWEPYELNSKTTILIPNVTVPGGYKVPGGYDGGGVTEFTNLDSVSTNQKVWMGTKYKKYIDILKEKLGENKVEVKWGYIGYWS